MSFGQLARKILGPRFFSVAGRWYRRLFINLDLLCSKLPPFPGNAHLLDVGGGDGEILNRILRKHPTLTVTMVDIAEQIGGAIQDQFRSRVNLLPTVSLADYAKIKKYPSDLILISCVVHHIPIAERDAFMKDLKNVTDPHTIIMINDVEPGLFRSRVDYWADRYISGERLVNQIGQEVMKQLVLAHFPGWSCYESGLFKDNKPNYCIIGQPNKNDRI